MCLPGDAGANALQSKELGSVGGIERKSTRVWAQDTGYNPPKLFNKVALISLTVLFSRCLLATVYI